MVDPKIKKRALHHANIIRGQLDGLIRAIEDETYCLTLLLQSLSIQRSLKSLDHLMLESHLKIHVAEQMQNPKDRQKAIDELLKVYSLSSKR